MHRQLRAHEGLCKASLERRLIALVIYRVRGIGIKQPLELPGHILRARIVRCVVSDDLIRHRIQIHVGCNRFTLEVAPRHSFVAINPLPLQEQLLQAAIRSLAQECDDCGVGFGIVGHFLWLHDGFTLVVIDRVAVLVHLGHLNCLNKAGIAILATQNTRIVRVYRSGVDDVAFGVVIAHFKRRLLVHRSVGHALKGLAALEGIPLIVSHQGVLPVIDIIARPADKVVLGAVSALNLLGGLDLKRNLVAGVSAAEATDKIGIRKFRVNVRLNGNQAGTVDRVQLHGGLDHGRSTHHTDAL